MPEQYRIRRSLLGKCILQKKVRKYLYEYDRHPFDSYSYHVWEDIKYQDLPLQPLNIQGNSND